MTDSKAPESLVQKPKSRLGRGLSSLMSSATLPVQAELTRSALALGDASSNNPAEVALELIDANPYQPRRDMAPEGLDSLAKSLAANGLIQPIIVRKSAGGRYQLIAGERRLRAAKIAKMTAIPVIVRDVDDLSQAQLALIENIHREALNPIERAQAYKGLLGQLHLTQNDLATKIGEERSTVANHLRLLELAESVQALVRAGELTLGHAKVLAAIDVDQQLSLAQRVVDEQLSVRQLEMLRATAAIPKQVEAAKKTSPAHMADLERSLTRQLGMKIQVRSRGKSKGRVVIHYGSLDQFDALVERLGAKLDD